MNVQQLAVGGFDSNFSYLLFDPESREAAIIDPCGDVGVIQKAVARLPGPLPRYILLTHGHRDHTSGIGEVKMFFDAPVAAHPSVPAGCDMALEDGRMLPLGGSFIECLYAPGHSGDSVVYRLSDDTAIFTGDTLFVDWCGYCDARTMFDTLRTVIYPLADKNEVYPGHDYGRYPHTSLGRQKIENPYLAATDYGRFREELKKL